MLFDYYKHPAYEEFRKIAHMIDGRFKEVLWAWVHEVNSITLRGYGLVQREERYMNFRFFNDFVLLSITNNPETGVVKRFIECSNKTLYEKICNKFPSYFEYKPYVPYGDYFQ